MPEPSAPSDERRAYLIDISLFIFDVLDPKKIEEHLKLGNRTLEVPGALVTMIWSARMGNPLLYNFIYAHILGMKKKGFFEKSQSVLIHKWAQADEEALKTLCSSVHDRLLSYYTSMIDGAYRGTSLELPIFRRYEPASGLGSEKELYILRGSYEAELGIEPHPLYDLYFLQVRHAQETGIAASPLLQRAFVFIGQQTVATLSRWIGQTDPQYVNQPARERYLRHMAWFCQEFLIDEVRDQAIEGVLGIGVSYALVGVPGINILTGVSVAAYVAKVAVQATMTSKYLTETDKYMWIGVFAALFLTCFCAITLWPTVRQSSIWNSARSPQATPTLDPLLAQLSTTPSQPTVPPTPALVFTATPAPVSIATDPPSSSYVEMGYCMVVIQPGDTLPGIAARFQMSEGDLRAGDKLLSWGAFTVGQMIHVNAPCCRPNGGYGISYTVSSGDTLFGIARSHGVSLNNLTAANSLYDPAYIQAGQMLCIP